MSTHKKGLGLIGEQIAVDYVVDKGYVVIGRNVVVWGKRAQ
jgi:hypothetical protein